MDQGGAAVCLHNQIWSLAKNVPPAAIAVKVVREEPEPFELFKGFRLLTNNFYSDGGGRYIFGQAPDLIVQADGSPSLIHASSTVSGFEYTHQNTVFYGYYGGLYIGRNVAIDENGELVGYGYAG